MWGVPELLQGIAVQAVDEVARYAYVASRLAPAGLVVMGAAVAAGLLGAASVKRVRAGRHRARVGDVRPASRTALLAAAVLAPALVASGLPSPAAAGVVCRKGRSPHLVLRAEGCRRHERAVDAAELGLALAPACEEAIATLWSDVRELRGLVEAARTLAMRLQAHPWPEGETWLAIHAIEIEQALAALARRLDAFGMANAGGQVASLRDLLRDGWDRPVDACTAMLALLPELEAALPVFPATADDRP